MPGTGTYLRLYAEVDALNIAAAGSGETATPARRCVIRAKKYALDALDITPLTEVPTGTDKNSKIYVIRGAVGTKTFRFKLRTPITPSTGKTFNYVGLPMPGYVGLLDVLNWVLADKRALVAAVVSPDGVSYGIDETAPA